MLPTVPSRGPTPAKPLLYTIGALGTFQGLLAIPVGLFVGPHILTAAVAMLAFGATALWLGCRRYNSFGRSATITWGVLATPLILLATGLQPPSMQDVAALVFIALLLLVVGAVPLLAFWNRSSVFTSQ